LAQRRLPLNFGRERNLRNRTTVSAELLPPFHKTARYMPPFLLSSYFFYFLKSASKKTKKEQSVENKISATLCRLKNFT
jgi:hypothetical protein